MSELLGVVRLALQLAAQQLDDRAPTDLAAGGENLGSAQP
jgi:hypothetical protein